MGCNEARAWIRFPAARMDAEIREVLEKNYDVNFKGDELIYEEEDRDIYIEKMLKEKEIPFDRVSFSDYGVAPVKRISRPDCLFDLTYPLDDDSEHVVVSVDKIREVFESTFMPVNLYRFLNEQFPPYPPLENFVPEIEEEKFNLKAAIEGIRTVDFSRFPGLYDKIPWADLDAAVDYENPLFGEVKSWEN